MNCGRILQSLYTAKKNHRPGVKASGILVLYHCLHLQKAYNVHLPSNAFVFLLFKSSKICLLLLVIPHLMKGQIISASSRGLNWENSLVILAELKNNDDSALLACYSFGHHCYYHLSFLDINRWNLRHGRRTNAKELYGKREKQWSPVKPRQQIAQ